MLSSVTIGIVAALFATLAWSLAFIVPSIIGDYSIFDFVLVEFGVSGLLGFGYIAVSRRRAAGLGLRDWLVAGWLGCIGYVGYFLALMGATRYAGPVIAPAFVGLVPVVLAVAGNLRQRTVSWQRLALPLSLAALGLLLVNCGGAWESGAALGNALPLGVGLALLALGLWTWFGLLNESALARRPHMDARTWAAVMMGGASVGMLAFVPIGWWYGLFELRRLGMHGDTAAALCLWATGMALLANVGASLAWTVASQRLPVVLAAQLITLEPTFGTVLGLSIRHQWPTTAEWVGMVLLLAGVSIAIRVFHAPRMPALAPDTA